MNDWGIGGHPQAITPHIDALAARGVTFTNAHSAGIKCGPSRAAIFTGQYPSTSGFYDDHVYWQDDENTPNTSYTGLHSAFKNAGYKTLGAGKLFHHVRGWTDKRDWDHYWFRTDDTTNEQRANFWELGSWVYDAPHPGGESQDYVSLYNITFPETSAGLMEWYPLDNAVEAQMADSQRTQWVVEQLNTDHGDTPFFIGLGLYTPHSPQYAPQKYYDAYFSGPLDGDIQNLELPLYWEDGTTSPLPDLEDIGPRERNRMTFNYNRWMAKLQSIGPNERGLKECLLGYLAAISYADAQIGRVLNALAESPYADNTIVVLWSDHGYHLGEKGNWSKQVLWERGTKVPFVWAGPGITPGATTDTIVSLIDMYPTLIELCDLTADGANDDLQLLDGLSLAPTLADPSQAQDRAVFTSYFQAFEYAIFNKDWRYIRYNTGAEELYDRNNDPHQWYNLAYDPTYQPVRAFMRSQTPENGADYAPRYRQGGLREREDGSWYFLDRNRKVDVTVSSDSPDLVSDNFDVRVKYTTDVTGFTPGDLELTNASITNFTQVDADLYTFTVVPDPSAVGELIVIEVPGGSARSVSNPSESQDRDVYIARRFHPDADSWITPTAIPEVTTLADLTMAVTSEHSFDPDGELDAWLWQFGDGTISTLANPSHTYANPGTYQVTLGVTDNDGLGSELVSLSVTVGPKPPMPAPAGLTATAGNGTIYLAWDDYENDELASYTVYRSTTSGSGLSIIETGLTSSDYIDTNATIGITHYYVVTAVDSDNNESLPSNEASATSEGRVVIITATPGTTNLLGDQGEFQVYAGETDIHMLDSVTDTPGGEIQDDGLTSSSDTLLEFIPAGGG